MPFLATRFFIALGVSSESPSGSKFSQFMTHHLLVHIDGDVLPSVVDCDRVADHLGQNCGSSRPSFDYLFFAFEFFQFFQQMIRNEGTFF